MIEDLQSWTKFDKAKTWDTKISILENFRCSTDLQTLDRLCKEFLKTTSPKYRNKAIPVIELLENKFETQHKLDNLVHYLRLKRKYKLANFRNFWFKDFKSIKSHNNAIEYIEEQTNNNYNTKISKFDINFKFNHGEHITGYVMTRYGKTTPFNVSLISYGLFTDLRNLAGHTLNDYPNFQYHLPSGNHVSYKVLRKIGKPFQLSQKFKTTINNFFANTETLISDMRLINSDTFSNSDKSDFFSKYILSKRNGLDAILTMTNISSFDNNQKEVKRFSELGLDIISKEQRFTQWKDYFGAHIIS